MDERKSRPKTVTKTPQEDEATSAIIVDKMEELGRVFREMDRRRHPDRTFLSDVMHNRAPIQGDMRQLIMHAQTILDEYPEVAQQNDKQSLLGRALSWACPYPVIELIYNLHPEAMKKEDIGGNFPLHTACSNQDTPNDTIIFLIKSIRLHEPKQIVMGKHHSMPSAVLCKERPQMKS
jgi:hypothetical protein